MGFGSTHRLAPIGGAAKGIPRKLRARLLTLPLTGPSLVCTTAAESNPSAECVSRTMTTTAAIIFIVTCKVDIGGVKVFKKGNLTADATRGHHMNEKPLHDFGVLGKPVVDGRRLPSAMGEVFFFRVMLLMFVLPMCWKTVTYVYSFYSFKVYNV
jgi:hypothetical protein